MNIFFEMYDRFLSIFPIQVQGIISLLLFILMIYAVFKIIKKEFIWIIVLIIILPAAIPILVKIWNYLVDILKYLLNRSSL
jgi:hypothetical protein